MEEGITMNENIMIKKEGPEELDKFIDLAIGVVDNYKKACEGVKKRSTEARKGLMEIKKLATEMRKMAMEKCKAAREQ